MDLLINFTPTGMIPTKEMAPEIPISVPEIVEEVHRAVELGITMVHLHARPPCSRRGVWSTNVRSGSLCANHCRYPHIRIRAGYLCVLERQKFPRVRTTG